MLTGKQVLPYHAADEHVKIKEFANGRSFTIVASSGLSGDHALNGIVVIDNDNRRVVLDLHLQGPSKIDVSERQTAEFRRILSLEWRDFAEFCTTARTYRGNIVALDFPARGPKPPNLLNRSLTTKTVPSDHGHVSPNILSPDLLALNANPGVPYKLLLSERDDIIARLGVHRGYVPASIEAGGFVLAWGIKVPMGSSDGARNDPQHDRRWAMLMNQNYQEFFQKACNLALARFREGRFTLANGESGFAFYTNGRSGSHLVLSDWSGPKPSGSASCPMSFDNRDSFIRWLMGLPNEDLAKLYHAVTAVDYELRPEAIFKEMSRQFRLLRIEQEKEWRSELASKPRSAHPWGDTDVSPT